MPVTPFHLGPGAAIHAVAPRHVSFLAFCLANAVVDLEPLYFLLTDQTPLHRFLHTGIGATVAWGVTCLLFAVAIRLAPRLRLPNWFQWQALNKVQVAVGAALGAYSHIAIDSFVHPEMAPWWPVMNSNPYYNAVSPTTVHWSCVGAAIVAVVLIGVRAYIQRRG
jgi:hypothetical protein